jgi:hypothetical protein
MSKKALHEKYRRLFAMPIEEYINERFSFVDWLSVRDVAKLSGPVQMSFQGDR